MRVLIALIVLQSLGCNRSALTDTGLEIYQVNKPYPDFTQQEGAECNYCLDVQSDDLYSEPILTENDIQTFDWLNQRIELTEDAKERIKALDIPLQGLPMAMVLNGEVVYSFWFWNVFSSFGCDRVMTYPTLDFKLALGLPEGNTYGEDPRFDQRLRTYVTQRIERN